MLYSGQKKNGFKVSIDGHGADDLFLGGYVDNIKDFSIGEFKTTWLIHMLLFIISLIK